MFILIDLHSDEEIEVEQEEVVIGRWGGGGLCDVYLPLRRDNREALKESRSVSSRHARISKRGEEYYLQDLGSRNGTWLVTERGKQRVVYWEKLGAEEEILLGTYAIKFVQEKKEEEREEILRVGTLEFDERRGRIKTPDSEYSLEDIERLISLIESRKISR